jgi:branched-chain amino acid transport system permease protein
MQLIASLLDGILIGFVYGVAAVGLTLIWGVMSVINLSHGPVMALGMFSTYLLFTNLGINPYLALIVVAGFGLLLGPPSLQSAGHVCRQYDHHRHRHGSL